MDEKIIGECEACGFEVYEGESYYMVNGMVYHDEDSCLAQMARDMMAAHRVGGAA